MKNAVDFSAFCGRWPFHQLAFYDTAGLEALHDGSGISAAFVSGLEAIFYADPLTADKELASRLPRPRYRHAISYNPTLGAARAGLAHALDSMTVDAVRIYPCVHGYSLSDNRVEELCRELAARSVPLFVTTRLEDPRISHMISPRGIDACECGDFLSLDSRPLTVICGMTCADIISLSGRTRGALFDMSGLRDGCFTLERIHEAGLAEHMVYGSCAPLSCLMSTMLQLELADIPEAVKTRIASGAAFFERQE